MLLLGLGLTIALLVALSIAAGWLVGWLVPDTLSLPWIGQVGFLDPLASGLSVVAVLGLSVFLMVPVASAFTGLFLDDVADAVEDDTLVSPRRRTSVPERRCQIRCAFWGWCWRPTSLPSRFTCCCRRWRR